MAGSLGIYPRISGIIGGTTRLNTRFSLNGQPADPFLFRRIDIYQGRVSEEFLVASIPINLTDNPFPIEQELTGSGDPVVGSYYFDFDAPLDLAAPETYFDVWRFIGSDPGTTDIDDESQWLAKCNQFWLCQQGWNADDGLIVPNFSFESLDLKFSKPERRTLRIGLMPQPLYDFDFNKIMPMIPQLCPTIHIETLNCEVLVEADPMTIGIRQGSFRVNPFELHYLVDTSAFLAGTYRYRVTLGLPSGETRTSDDLFMTIY